MSNFLNHYTFTFGNGSTFFCTPSEAKTMAERMKTVVLSRTKVK